MGKSACTVCAWERTTGKSVDTSKAKTAWAEEIGTSEGSVRRHLKHPAKSSVLPSYGSDSTDKGKVTEFIRSRPVTLEDARQWVRDSGDEPEDYELSVRSIAYGDGLSSNRMTAIPKRAGKGAGPEWPVVQQAKPVVVKFATTPETPARNGMKLGFKCADPQIGYRSVGTGYEEFHDLKAMNVFTKVVHAEQPDSIMILGDFLDLPSQSRWAQEAGFARTTQMSLDMGHEWLAALRAAAPDARIVLIEGNHDKRLQTHLETNALASFGLKRANMPSDWPVMSISYLLRLDELNIEYMDAYPTAVAWDDDNTRNIHGTRANSKGSTTSQYMHDLPHISTWVGHTHRAEITYKTVMGARGEAIESYTANPGALCKTDGTVPSVHGAIHADGTSAKVVEDWQQGWGSLLYGDGQAWPQVHRIKDGVTLYNGKRYVA